MRSYTSKEMTIAQLYSHDESSVRDCPIRDSFVNQW